MSETGDTENSEETQDVMPGLPEDMWFKACKAAFGSWIEGLDDDQMRVLFEGILGAIPGDQPGHALQQRKMQLNGWVDMIDFQGWDPDWSSMAARLSYLVHTIDWNFARPLSKDAEGGFNIMLDGVADADQGSVNSFVSGSAVAADREIWEQLRASWSALRAGDLAERKLQLWIISQSDDLSEIPVDTSTGHHWGGSVGDGSQTDGAPQDVMQSWLLSIESERIAMVLSDFYNSYFPTDMMRQADKQAEHFGDWFAAADIEAPQGVALWAAKQTAIYNRLSIFFTVVESEMRKLFNGAEFEHHEKMFGPFVRGEKTLEESAPQLFGIVPPGMTKEEYVKMTEQFAREQMEQLSINKETCRKIGENWDQLRASILNEKSLRAWCVKERSATSSQESDVSAS